MKFRTLIVLAAIAVTAVSALAGATGSVNQDSGVQTEGALISDVRLGAGPFDSRQIVEFSDVNAFFVTGMTPGGAKTGRWAMDLSLFTSGGLAVRP